MSHYRLLSFAALVLAVGCSADGTQGSGEPVSDSTDDGGAAVPAPKAEPDAGATSFGATPPTPAAAGETACDGLDNDKNGKVDDGCSCQVGAKQKCYAGDPARAGKGVCTFGSQTCAKAGSTEFEKTSWGECTGSGAPATEICGNGLDDDCDGVVDNGCKPCDKYFAVSNGVVSGNHDCSCYNVPASVTRCEGGRDSGRGALPSPLASVASPPAGAQPFGIRWQSNGRCDKKDGWDYDEWLQSTIYVKHCADCSAKAADPACVTP